MMRFQSHHEPQPYDMSLAGMTPVIRLSRKSNTLRHIVIQNNPWIYHSALTSFSASSVFRAAFSSGALISVPLLALVVFSIGSRCGRGSLRIRGSLRFRYLCGFLSFRKRRPSSSLSSETAVVTFSVGFEVSTYGCTLVEVF